MLDAWLDLVQGGRCVGCDRPGRLLCRGCAQELPATAVPVRPTPCPPGLRPCAAAGEYAGLLRALVLAHKEHRAFALARPLGSLLATSVEAVVALAEADDRTACLLVPVPSRPAVVRERGHDPMLRAARAAAIGLRRRGHRMQVAALLRQRLRPGDQAGLGAAQRAANISDSLVARGGALRALARRGDAVLAVVCDDVLTTGATAREAQRALEDAGVPVAGIACVAATRRRASAGVGPPVTPRLPF